MNNEKGFITSTKRKKAKHEYILGCADCGEMINSSSDKSFLTAKSDRWKNHVAKDCMGGDYK